MPVRDIVIAGIHAGSAQPGPETLAVMRSSSVVLCARRLLDTLDGTVPMKPYDKVSALPASVAAAEGGTVCILATGDPGFFGIVGYLERVLPGRIARVIPAVSSMQRAFAALRTGWGDAAFFSIHGRSSEGLAAFLLTHAKGCVLTSGAADARAVLAMLRTLRIEDATVHLCQDMGMPRERVTSLGWPFTPPRRISELNLVVMQRAATPGAYPGLGLPEASYHAVRGMITKREVRVAALSLLALQPGQIVWDLGAGSGSVAIEASFNPAGTRVFAVEKDAAAFANLVRNIGRFGAVNVHAVRGESPSVVRTLPVPDRIFIGGGAADVLPAAWRALKPGGILVVSSVTGATTSLVTSFLGRRKIRFDRVAITAERGMPGSDAVRAMNRIELFSTGKPA